LAISSNISKICLVPFSSVPKHMFTKIPSMSTFCIYEAQDFTYNIFFFKISYILHFLIFFLDNYQSISFFDHTIWYFTRCIAKHFDFDIFKLILSALRIRNCNFSSIMYMIMVLRCKNKKG
jgi:hypothetical protein